MNNKTKVYIGRLISSISLERVYCKDGFSVSVASGSHYHSRRKDGVLTHVELGYPQYKGEATYEPLLKEWAREEGGVLTQEDMWNVSVDLLTEVIESHGGLDRCKRVI